MSISTLSLRARLLSGAVCLSVLGLMPAHAFAETPASPDKTTVSEVIVVGGSNRPITVQPRGLSVSLGAEDFARINAVNVEDLMKYAPDFAVRKRYIGDSNAILGIRGTNYMQTARALVLVDGFVVSNFLGANYSYPPKWGVIAPGEVEHVQQPELRSLVGHERDHGREDAGAEWGHGLGSDAHAQRLPFAQRLGVARGDVGVFRILADRRRDLP